MNNVFKVIAICGGVIVVVFGAAFGLFLLPLSIGLWSYNFLSRELGGIKDDYAKAFAKFDGKGGAA